MAFVRKPGEEMPIVLIGEEKEEYAAFVALHPAIWEYLTQDHWEDGKRRDRSSLSVVVEGSTWKVGLQDRAGKRSVWKSAGSLEGALRALEGALQGGSLDWRKWSR